MSQVVFDIYSIADIVPPKYDHQTFYIRYNNGVKAEGLREYEETKEKLEPLLRSAPRTMNELVRQVQVQPKILGRILDYLFTHTAEIAALEVPGRDTFYIWADAEVAEQMRADFALGSIAFDSEYIRPEDVPELTAYITSLLVLRPAVEVLDATIEKTQRLYDAFRIKQSMTPDPKTQANIRLLGEKLKQLRERRAQEVQRWGPPKSDHAEEEAESGAGRAAGPTSGRQNAHARGDGDAEAKYPFESVYILGSDYQYSGSEKEKRFCWRDRRLRSMDFSRTSRVVVEMDTFSQDIAEGYSILELVERYVKPGFKNPRTEIVFRRIGGISYPRAVGKRLHRETVALIERGYRVLR